MCQWLRYGGIVGLLICVGGQSSCSRFARETVHTPAVRVDSSSAPELAEQGERLRQVAIVVYPEILRITGDVSSRTPRSFNIAFTNDPGGNVGQAVGRTIYLNAYYIATPLRPDGVLRNAADLDAILVHEMTHVAQQYDASASVHWTEGMADYMCARLGYTNALNCAHCSASYPHYRSGYQCAAAFLAFLEEQYCPRIVPELHQRLRRGSYGDDFFRGMCGKDLAQLWLEFQQTAAYPASARQSLELQTTLGFQNGKAPPDILRRTESHFKLQEGSLTNSLASLLALKTSGRLPGFVGAERASATLTSESFGEQMPGVHPFAVTWWMRKTGEASWYAFTVEQRGEGEPWELQVAQRVSSDYRVRENLIAPTQAR